MVAAATFLGIMPVTTLLGRSMWAYVFWILALAVSGLYVKGYVKFSTDEPEAVDYLASFFSSLYPVIGLGVFWLVFYSFAFSVVFLIQLGLLALGIQLPSWLPDAIAFYVSLAPVILLSLGMPWFLLLTTRSYLYPDAAGVRTGFRRLSRKRQRRLVWICLSILVLGLSLGLLSVYLQGRWFQVSYGALLIVVLFVSASFWSSGVPADRSRPRTPHWVWRRFSSTSNSRCARHLSVGDARVDPLLMELDLVAVNANVAIAVKLKVSTANRANHPEDTELSWEVGPVVLAAAAAARKVLPGEISFVVPLLVLVGLKPSEALAEFTREEQLVCLELPHHLLEATRTGATAALSKSEGYFSPIFADIREMRDPRWFRPEQPRHESSPVGQASDWSVGSFGNSTAVGGAEG